MEEAIEKIKVATGRQIYSFMRKLKSRIDSGEKNPNLKIYWKECFDRAKKLVEGRYGNWEDACRKLDLVSEPNIVNKFQNDRINIDLAPINGYPCQYTKEKIGNQYKSALMLTNGKKNVMYIRNFGDVSPKTAKKMFK